MIEFLNRLFESREYAHGYHLKTTSFAEHLALQTYYETIIDMIDELAETYQGQYEIIDDYQIIVRNIKKQTPVEYFDELANYVHIKRKDIINPETEHLISLIDNIHVLIYKTIYKLKNLK